MRQYYSYSINAILWIYRLHVNSSHGCRNVAYRAICDSHSLATIAHSHSWVKWVTDMRVMQYPRTDTAARWHFYPVASSLKRYIRNSLCYIGIVFVIHGRQFDIGRVASTPGIWCRCISRRYWLKIFESLVWKSWFQLAIKTFCLNARKQAQGWFVRSNCIVYMITRLVLQDMNTMQYINRLLYFKKPTETNLPQKLIIISPLGVSYVE